MDTINWDTDIWNIVHSYFQNINNYLSSHQINSYNTFLDTNISKTIRQFNPIVLPYNKVIDPVTGKSTEDYELELRITIGGSTNENNDVINDGSSIYIGKPIIQEIKYTNTDPVLYRKTLYPNEARLKNITYKCAIKANVFIEFYIRNDEGELKRDIPPKLFEKVTITNNLPIMLQSKICSLAGLSGTSLRIMGECEYDQGGYFIIDGKEKVIVAQERQIENKLYITRKKDGERYKYITDIRSAPENKLQPARITKCMVLNATKSMKESIENNVIRLSIPNINGEVPICIVFRALGIISDYDICSTIVDNFDQTISLKLLELLQPSIREGIVINNQADALEFLESKISTAFMTSNIAKHKRKHFLANIMKDYLLPHCGTDNYTKAYYLGHMVKETLYALLEIKKPTDRDSYLYKRVDISGFLISAIFRDLYFRVKNKLIENINIFYATKDGETEGYYWNQYPQDEFLKSGFKNYKIYNIISETEIEGGGIPIQRVLDQTIMDEGLLYAFKNCWGLKNAPCKQGVVQDMNRLSYLGAVSHIRRINTPLSKSAKVRAPHSLHLSSFGIMCPDETPDGGNVGLRKNLSIFSTITSGTNSENLMRLLYDTGLEDIIQIESDKLNYTKVFLNERLVGYTKKPHFLSQKLKLLKRNALINIYTSIAWYIEDKCIKISTDSGRGVRPVFVVKDHNIAITKDIISRLMDPDDIYNWYHLVGGTRNLDKSVPYNDTDGKFYNIDDIDNLVKLEETAGVIEYIDPEESNISLIAMYPKDLTNHIDKYNYCEIHPAINFGVLASVIPGIEMNQHPRNQFSTGQGKQALGIYTSNFRNRMDTKGQIMYYPQKPIVKSKLSKYLRVDELPHGINTIVAIGCYSGYNQEDSIIFNKSSVERGLFKTTKFRTFSDREEIDGSVQREYICNPDPSSVQNMKSGNYKKLDANGIIKEGLKVSENDVLIGKCIYTGEKNPTGAETILDNSQFVRRNEEGFVDKVYSNVGNNNQRYVKVRIRKDKMPEIGDKFCSRHGQKGTVGMLLPARDMPVSKNGITPDIIVNPHAIPSRMTIAQFFETLLGKMCVQKGFLSEIIPFSENNIDSVATILENHCGFEKYGNEILYSGITGEELKVNFFIGPTYYLRLTHQVSDKYQARDDGLKTALTHQPVSGRALGGGGRIGEMERDAVLSHGISSFLKESFMERSDKYKFYISTKSGLISAVNPDKNIFRDFTNDSTVQYVDENNQVVKRTVNSSDSEFVCIEAPYSFKLFLQEVESMGIAPRLIAKSVLEAWNNISDKTIPTNFQQHSNLERSREDGSYYTSTGTDLTKPLRRFHNQIKQNLLLGTSKKNGNLIDFSCGAGGDLYKWKNANYRNILAIDLSPNNIEATSGIVGAMQRLKEMKNSENEFDQHWALNSDITFIAGDSSKSLYNLSMTEGFNESYQSLLRTKLESFGKHFFDSSAMLFSIHYLFDDYNRLDTLLKNVRESINRFGYFIVTTLDGPSVYKLLQENRKLSGNVYNISTRKKEEVWSIKPSTNLDLTKRSLPSTVTDGFNHNIKVNFESIGQEYEESLVHPALLITMAAKHGLKLLSSNEVIEKFPLFSNSSDLFKNVYKRYIKMNPSDKDVLHLGDAEFEELKTYSDLHRYFIFKSDKYQIIPNLTFTKLQECSQKSSKIIHNERRYPTISLALPSALDIKLINTYITEHRAIVGNTNYNIAEYDNSILSVQSDIYNIFIRDINSKLSNTYFSKISNETYENTINYIYKYIKLGIYIRIVNSELIQFVPIYNYGSNKSPLINKDVQYVINSGDFEKHVTIDEFIQDKYSKSNPETNIHEVFNNLSDSYSHLSVLFKQHKQIEETTLFNNNFIMNGPQVLIGKQVFHLFRKQIGTYKHIFESLCIQKKGNINDSEFILNVLQHPVLNVNQSGFLDNPFSDFLKESANIIQIDGNTLPIIGSSELPGFLDLAIPTVLNWEFVNEDYTVYSCNDPIIIPKQDPDSLLDLIGVIINSNGYQMNNHREEFIKNINKINLDISDPVEDSNYDFALVLFMYNPIIPNMIYNNEIRYVNNPNEMKTLFEFEEIDKFPVDAKILLYIDGFCSDDILTLSAKSNSVLFVLRPSIITPQLWYEKSLIPMEFNKYTKRDESEINEDYILLNSLDELKPAARLMSDDPLLFTKLINNRQEKIRQLFSKKTIIDYMQMVVNKIGNKMNIDQIEHDIFNTEITEADSRQIIHMPSMFVGILKGRKGKNIIRIQNITATNIEISKETLDNEGVESNTVTITGGISGVTIASEIINKLAKSVIVFKEVEQSAIGFIIGKRMENKNMLENFYNLAIYTRIYDEDIITHLEKVFPNQNISELTQKYTVIKLVGSEDSIKHCLESMDYLVRPGKYETKKKYTETHMRTYTGSVLPDTIDLSDSTDILYDKKTWMIDSYDEDLETSETSEITPKINVLPKGWINISRETESDMEFKSLVTNEKGEPTEIWHSIRNNTDIPDRHPLGWDNELLIENGISEQQIHNYLMIYNNIPNNFTEGITALKYSLRADSPVLPPNTPPPAPLDSPVLPPASPVLPPASPIESDLVQIGGNQFNKVVSTIKSSKLNPLDIHYDNNDLLIVFAIDEETDSTTELVGGGFSLLSKSINSYLKRFKDKMDEYVSIQLQGGYHMNYKILLVSHNMCIMTNSELKFHMIPTELTEKIISVSDTGEVTYKMKLNKGCLYNIAGNIAMGDSHIKTILFHELYLIPNSRLLSYYFTNPGGNIIKLNTSLEYFTDEYSLGSFLIDKSLFYANSFPNHIWSRSYIDRVFIEGLKKKGVPVKSIIDDLIEITDLKPSYHTIDILDKTTMEDVLYSTYTDIKRNKWYSTTNVSTIHPNCILYEVKLNFNTYPISSMPYQSHLWDKILDKFPKTKHFDLILNYISVYINNVFDVKVVEDKNKSGVITSIQVNIGLLSSLDQVNILIRLKTLLSLLRGAILTKSTPLTQDTHIIMTHAYFLISKLSDSNIRIKLQSIESKSKKHFELKVAIPDLFTKYPQNITYQFAEIMDFNYSEYIERDQFEDLLLSIKDSILKDLTVTDINDFTQKRKEFSQQNVYIVMEEMGDTDILLDTLTDSVKYLNLRNMTIQETPPNGLLLPLHEKRFLVVMKYKHSKPLIVDSVKLNNVLDTAYYDKYTVGSKVIVVVGEHINKIGTIKEIYISNLILDIGGALVELDVSINNPEETVLLLDDVLLEEADIEEVKQDSISGKIIGKFMNKEEPHTKLLVENTDKSYTIIDEVEITPHSNKEFNVGDLVIIHADSDTYNGIYNGISDNGNYNIIIDEEIRTFNPDKVFIMEDIDNKSKEIVESIDNESNSEVSTSSSKSQTKSKDSSKKIITLKTENTPKKDTVSTKEDANKDSWSNKLYNNMPVKSSVLVEGSPPQPNWKGTVVKTGGKNTKNAVIKPEAYKSNVKIPYGIILKYTDSNGKEISRPT